MLDNIIVKKLGIITDVIDIDKSYMSYDSTTCYNIIELYLKKEDNVVCPRCCDYNVYVKGSRITETKTASADMHNVLVRVHRVFTNAVIVINFHKRIHYLLQTGR